MSRRFDSFYRGNKYTKPVKKGDYVYIFDIDEIYEAETIYKVHYVKTDKILVEVDPERNKADLDVICGWDYTSRNSIDIELYKIERDKLYWWVSSWLKASSNNYFINNE